MSELTQEYFDQALTGLETRVIKRIDESQEELARMVSAGFDDVHRRLDVADQIKKHDKKFNKLEDALHIKL